MKDAVQLSHAALRLLSGSKNASSVGRANFDAHLSKFGHEALAERLTGLFAEVQ
jgi:hypothetical protein